MKTLFKLFFYIGDLFVRFLWHFVLPISMLLIAFSIIIFSWGYYKPEHFEPEPISKQYKSVLFTDTDGCVYKIIKPRNMSNQMGVVLHRGCRKDD